MTPGQQRDAKGKWVRTAGSLPRAEQNRIATRRNYWRNWDREKAKRSTEAYRARRRREKRAQIAAVTRGYARELLKAQRHIPAGMFSSELVALKTAQLKLKRTLNEKHQRPDRSIA